jgi:hypothetical protein
MEPSVSDPMLDVGKSQIEASLGGMVCGGVGATLGCGSPVILP